ncbi:amino acid permease [Agromyces sp. ISL-38]|uniref:APC family permease n=1 Tax=Agromyces sp. ISL-38 TaxID=2819107 RepID=UPI0027DEAC50|nr:amino acid permease [Agromyces sp. ISL-38]
MTSNQPATATATAAATATDGGGAKTHGGTLGLGQGTALYIGSVLGTGILVLPGLAAAAAGPASILAVAAVLVLSIPLAGTFAALAARYPDAGGVASFVRRALGGTAARMTGYWFYFGVCVGAPVLAILGGEYVVAVLGVDRSAVPIIGFAVFVPPFIANWFGVRVAGWVQFVLTGLLLAVVVGVVAVTFPAVETSNFQPFLPNGWTGVGLAISLFVWAFAGWEVGTHIAGEFKNPRRTIPLATGIAIVVVGAGYLALQFVTVAVLGDRAGDGQAPLVDLVETTMPGVGPVLIAIVAAIVTFGVMNAYLPAFGKLGAALGRDGDLPRFFAKGAADGEIPRRALALTGVLITVYFGLMLLNDLDLTGFILIHTSNMVAIYALGMLAATLLLRRWSLGWWLAVVATIMTAGLLVLAWANLVVPLVLAVAAVIVSLVRRVRRGGSGRADASSDASSIAAPSERATAGNLDTRRASRGATRSPDAAASRGATRSPGAAASRGATRSPGARGAARSPDVTVLAGATSATPAAASATPEETE